jgi:hypothetical protein
MKCSKLVFFLLALLCFGAVSAFAQDMDFGADMGMEDQRLAGSFDLGPSFLPLLPPIPLFPVLESGSTDLATVPDSSSTFILLPASIFAILAARKRGIVLNTIG